MDLMTTTFFRRSLAESSARLLVFFITLALLTSPFLVPQPVLVVALGLFDLILALVVLFLLNQRFVTVLGPHLVIATSYLCIMPLVVLTGGIHSYFIYLVPFSPIMSGLLLSARAAVTIALFLILNLVALLLLSDSLPSAYSPPPQEDGDTLLRTYWLILTTIITTIFVSYYEQFNDMLRNQLQELAFKDSLTTIPNRRSIMEALQLTWDIARKENTWISVIMIDLDNFKELNDTHGHDIGDKCLVQISASLKKSIRSRQDLVGRLGGEEFVAILPGVAPDNLPRIAENIRRNIESTAIRIDENMNIRVTATLGCCCCRASWLNSPDELLKLADTALYSGKNKGKNQVVVDVQE